MTYDLTLSDSSTITNSAVVFDDSTLIVSLFSTDLADEETLPLMLTATSVDNGAVSESSYFQLDILGYTQNLYAPEFLTALQAEIEVNVNSTEYIVLPAF